MHPAVSVIFFTVVSGAGFGLIATIGAGMPLPDGPLAASLVSALAGLLAVAGLVSSTFHLGRPERAWRALSQWRSSWLSREGVAAVVALGLFGSYALVWTIAGERPIWLGLASALAALATVYTTAMIYAQLKTVPCWHTRLTPACYLAFSLSGGFVLAAGLSGFADERPEFAVPAFLAILAAWSCKFAWWKRAEAVRLPNAGASVEAATGLGFIGRVRLFERPHTGENYLTREMVHVIARKHAARLRRIALAVGAALPLAVALTVWALAASTIWLVAAFAAMIAGLFIERWLFFAEAEHVVSLYYGGGRE